MKLALILNVIDPTVGGVLILGDRGTAKSVAVRSLVDLLPELEVVADDSFNSHPTDTKLMGPDALERYEAGEQLPTAKIPTPLVELPLGATEDRICGTLDIEKALAEAVKALEPGLLAKANRGIMYIDEVNLLDDGLVDVVLDSAASGVNTVEREGVSLQHPAKFIMIGSGNPEEGELRPQLLDRFGLSVQVSTVMDKDDRVALVLDRLDFERDPVAFNARAEEEMETLRGQIEAARQLLPKVTVPRDVRLKIAEACSVLGVEGLRGDLVVNRAACAMVALDGREEVEVGDVDKVLLMCMNHRMRRDPLDPMDNTTKVMKAWDRVKDPEKYKKAEEAMRKRIEEAKAAAKAKGQDPEKPEKKAGAWGGLPGR